MASHVGGHRQRARHTWQVGAHAISALSDRGGRTAVCLVYICRSQWLPAATWLGCTMLVAIVAGVLLNSVHAPIYGGGLVQLAFMSALAIAPPGG